MVTKKLVSAALLIGAVSLAFASAAPASAAHKGAPASAAHKGAPASAAHKKLIVVIGFAPPGYNEATKQWQNGYDAAAKKIAKTYTVQYKYAAQITFDPTQLVNLIRAALALHPAGIVIDSSAGPATESTLEGVIKAGIKVVAVDNPLPGLAGLTSYVGTNNLAAGRLAAKAMVSAYKTGKMMSNEVAILGSTPGSASLDQRTQGFMSGIAGSGLRVVSNVAPTCDIAKAESDLADIVTAHPKLGGVFGNCGQDGQGAAQTLVNRNKLEVVNVTIDPLVATINAMIARKGVTALVAQHLYAMTYTALSAMAQALDGKTVPPGIDSGVELVTPATANKFLKTYLAQLNG